MTRLKKTIFSVFGMALLSTGFVACSSDDNSTTESTLTAETTNSTMSVKEEFQFVSVPLPDYLQSSASEGTIIEAAVKLKNAKGKEFSGAIRYTVDKTGEKLNKVELSSNLIEEGAIRKDIFVSNPDITNEVFGSSSPHADCVKTCRDNFTNDKGETTTGYGHCIAGCYIESTGRLIESIGRAIGEAVDKLELSLSKVF